MNQIKHSFQDRKSQFQIDCFKLFIMHCERMVIVLQFSPWCLWSRYNTMNVQWAHPGHFAEGIKCSRDLICIRYAVFRVVRDLLDECFDKNVLSKAQKPRS